MDMTVAPAERETGSDDEPWELPAGWCWTAIERVAPVNPSTTFEELPTETELSFVPMAAVSEETGAINLSARRPVSAVAKGYVRFQQGDVLFAKITPCMENGKVAPVPELAEGFAAGSTEFHVLRPIAVDQKFLWYWLVSRRFRHEAQRNMSGSAGQLRVPAAFLRDSLLPLAPLAEQRRIVERIDTLFAEIAEGEAALEEARKGLETFRRALLKAAVTGELTRDWREVNRPSETGHDLLARIKAERAGKSSKGRGKRAEAREPLDPSDLPDLPEEWAWARMGELFDISTGATPSRSDPNLWNGDIPWVSSGEVAFCRIRETRETISLSGLGNAATRLNPPGTVLLAMIGEGKTRGQCAILEISAANNQNCAAIRVSATPIPPDYIHLVLEQQYFTSRKASQGGNQPALNAGKIGSMTIPVPPLEEIDEIVNIVAKLSSACADTLAGLSSASLDFARLRQAVLKSAFEGTLVPQDPNDEPAWALLARLKDQSAPTKPKRRGSKGKAGDVA